MPSSQQNLITWNPRFNTGHEQIDAQHRALVDLLNQFAVHVGKEHEGNGHIELFKQFKNTLLEHFAYEEDVLRQMGIAQHRIDAHTKHHNDSMQLLEKLGHHLVNDPREYSVAVLAAIAHCLMEDMLDEDSHYFASTASMSELTRSTPIAPVLHAFGRLVDLLNNQRERIAEARDYYITLLDDFPTPVCRANSAGKFDWYNQTWLSLTGVNAATDSNWIDAIHSEDRSRFLELWHECFAAHAPCTADFKLANAAGEWRWIHHIGHPFFDDEGAFLGYICTLIDITGRRRAEDNLRVSAEVFEHAIEAIMITDAKGVIEAVNPAFTRISGYSAEEAVGASTNLLRSGFHDEAYYAELWQNVVSQGHWQGEIVNRRKDGGIFPVWLSITTIRNVSGEIVRMVGVFNDITSARTSREHLMHLAHHDALTNLPNRLLFNARAQHSLERCIREGSRLAMLFIDLDNFKPVNDLLGHKAGDHLLCEVSTRLSQALRNEDTVARFGGDEFVVLVERAESLGDAQSVADKLLATFPVVVSIGAQSISVAASIGISLYPEDGQTVNELIEAADRAMYRVKQKRQRAAS